MPFRRRLRTLALLGCIVRLAAPSISFAEETSAANVAEARRHFEKARAFYGQGEYREAVHELELAHTADPNAKDLVFNLGVVHEKLSDIDEALRWFRLFKTMDLAPQERDRADAYVHRLEGAKREIETRQPAAEPAAAPPSPPAEPPPPPPQPATAPPTSPTPPRVILRPPVTRRLPPPPLPVPPARPDGLTIGFAGLAAGALAFGVVMAVKAEGDRPGPNFVVGQDGSYAFLTSRVDDAFREAVLADVGFGTALVSGFAAAYVYFVRSRPVSPASSGSTTVSAGPAAGGGATLLVKGCF